MPVVTKGVLLPTFDFFLLLSSGKLSIKKTVSERNISDADRSYFCQQREKNAKSQVICKEGTLTKNYCG